MNTKKKTYRKGFLALRNALSEEERAAGDAAILEKLKRMPEYKNAIYVLSYVSYRSEADTYGVLKDALSKGKQIAAPRITGPGEMSFIRINALSDLIDGYQHIPEPAPVWNEELTSGLLIVPALGFDHNGFRLGYGGGYYDRWLKNHRDYIVTCGIAYDCQLINELPISDYDQPVDYIITPTQIIRTDPKFRTSGQSYN